MTTLAWPLVRCDRRGCHAAAVSDSECCGRTYARCAAHGGDAGVRRSLHSHAALYHPGKAEMQP